MPNVYVDPTSPAHLNNVLFEKSERYNQNNCREPFQFLKERGIQHNLHFQTIDFWAPEKAESTDIYLSFDHKILARKLYWRMRSKKYPIVDMKKFAKRVLFQFEPPLVIPEIRYVTSKMPQFYDSVFFTWKTGNPNIRLFFTPLPIPRQGIFPEYWANTNRKFLCLIHSNRKTLFRYKELLTARVRAILFFAKTNEIDLYGFGWDERPLFPYWFARKNIARVYKGSVQDKYRVLSDYTFGFAFENCELPGYITDKIFDCMYAGTIPIYLGAPDIEEYIPKSCFVDVRDFQSYDDLSKFLKSLSEQDIETYRENGRQFLESEQAKPFGKEHFTQLVLNAIWKNQ